MDLDMKALMVSQMKLPRRLVSVQDQHSGHGYEPVSIGLVSCDHANGMC